jgi:hypothetical protein
MPSRLGWGKERPMAKWAEIDAALAAIRKGGE